MADPIDSDTTEREEELSTLQAIYPELEQCLSDPDISHLELPVQTTIPFRISLPKTSKKELLPLLENGSVDYYIHEITHLPSLQLRIELPKKYPSAAPPILKLSTSPPWLPRSVLSDLEAQASALWEEYGRVQILFVLIDQLQQAAETGFGLAPDALDTSGEDAFSTKQQLLSYDIQRKNEVFEQETFSCGVCLEPKKGSACHRLEQCGHVFCVACLTNFFNSCISEGDVTSVRCLDINCSAEHGDGKKSTSRRMLQSRELLQIPLAEEVVKRYVKMRRKKIIESDKDTIYCPRKWCQGPAKSKKYPEITSLEDWPAYLDGFGPETDSTSSEEVDHAKTENKPQGLLKYQPGERLAVCEECKYAFCRVCKQGWHGEYLTCWPRDKAEISAEERETLNYIRRYTTACPTCATPCQKAEGCNHMQCFQCNTHFCYLCSAWLDPANPYRHFSDENVPCYRKLFEQIEGIDPVREGNGELLDEVEIWNAAVAS